MYLDESRDIFEQQRRGIRKHDGGSFVTAAHRQGFGDLFLSCIAQLQMRNLI